MPTARSRSRLVETVIAAFLLLASVARAADDPKWAFKPIVRPSVPEAKRADWILNPIDAFILAKLEENGLSPSPPADRRTLIRRVSFDLIGLPPTPEEIEAFIADRDPKAYEKLVDRLLASPRYGERWGRHWLDVVRFAETNGFEMNQPRPNAWPYRDYVIRSFNEDKPYDQFVREQIAGDALGVQEATGFLVAGAWDQVKSPDPVLTAQQRADELHDMVSVTAGTFLGLTVGCARCHDHKFDPITQLDYYRMTALFAGVQHGERVWKPELEAAQRERVAAVRKEINVVDAKLDAFQPLTDAVSHEAHRPAVEIRRNVERFESVLAKSIRFTVSAVNTGSEPCIDELEVWSIDARNVALASAGAKAAASGTYPNSDLHKLEHLNDGRYGNSRSWISNEAGRGWVTIEFAQPATIDRVVWGRDRDKQFTDRLATEYSVEVEDEAGAWHFVAGSNDRAMFGAANKNKLASIDAVAEELLSQKRTLEGKLAALLAESPGKVYAGVFTEPSPTHKLNRGDPMQPKEVVSPGGVAAIAPELELKADAPEQSRRVALANWLTDPANPLPARVMMNRLWHHHFGRGLVATPGDFGKMGVRPTHAELLDWLASEFTADGWRLKAMHRLIVLSATYRQASAARPEANAIDSESTLLWRYPPRRLEAEPIRDAVLQATGLLDETIGGPGYDAFKPNDNYVRVYLAKTEFGPAEWRRMVYQFRPRLQQEPTFGVFDCPDGGQAAPRRTVSTTPLQALNLMNSPFMMQQAERFAERLKKEAGDDASAQVDRAFELTFSRPPTEAERAASVRFIESQDLSLFCRTLFNANEFLHVF